MEECDDDAEDGFTEDYVPAMATDLSTAYSDSDLIDGTDSEYIDTRMYVDCALYLGEKNLS